MLSKLIRGAIFASLVTLGASCSGSSVTPGNGPDVAGVIGKAERAKVFANTNRAFMEVSACMAMDPGPTTLTPSGTTQTQSQCSGQMIGQRDPELAKMLEIGQSAGGMTVRTTGYSDYAVTSWVSAGEGKLRSYTIAVTPKNEGAHIRSCNPPDPESCPDGQWPDM